MLFRSPVISAYILPLCLSDHHREQMLIEYSTHRITETYKLIPLADTWLSAAMLCDVLLAYVLDSACGLGYGQDSELGSSGLLYTHLWKSRTGFRSV